MDWLSYGAALVIVAVTTNTPQFKLFERNLFQTIHYTMQGSKPKLDRHVYFENCFEARIAGATPLYKGDPGYRLGLDPDRDGVACDLWGTH